MDVLSQKWCQNFLKFAHTVASCSKDTSSKVGCFIVGTDGSPLSWGYNGLPQYVKDDIPERFVRPEKYRWVSHAERNALDLAKTSLEGSVLFCTHMSCVECTKSIIQNKISHIVVDAHNGYGSEFWERMKDDYEYSMQMIKEVQEHRLLTYNEVYSNVYLNHKDGLVKNRN